MLLPKDYLVVSPNQLKNILKNCKIPQGNIQSILEKCMQYTLTNEESDIEEGKILNREEIGTRLFTILERKQILTEKQLKDFVLFSGKQELVNIRGVGQKSLNDLESLFPWLKEMT